MLYFNFKNFEEFKELFGKRVANNGKVVRSNGILLSFYKHAFKNKIEFADITNMSQLYDYALNLLSTKGRSKNYSINVMKHTFYSSVYKTDYQKGLCLDGDCNAIRYIVVDTNREYKMKVGKFLRKLITEIHLDELLGEQVVTYVCEEFSNKWRAYAQTEQPNEYTLIVDDDFEAIYNSSNHPDNESGYGRASFDSCMVNESQDAFYKYSVKALAASIWKNDRMYARCIIFTEVTDQDGVAYRLAERQYAAGGSDLLKQILVNMLISGGHIDGYKKIGASCHSSRLFIANDGTDLSDKEFSIKCWLELDDTLSYQDSFKWYDIDSNTAYNHDMNYYTHMLDTTNRYLQGSCWDDYHERYCQETTEVYVWNRRTCQYDRMECDTDALDDFTWIEYYNGYYDEYASCEECGCDIPYDEAVYCEYEGRYACSDCAIYFEPANSYFSSENAIEDWKSENWHQCDDCNEYFESSDDLIEVNQWHAWSKRYITYYVCRECLENGGYTLYEDEWYDEVNEDGIPYHLAEQLQEETA